MAVQALTGPELAQRLEAALPGVVERWDPEVVWVFSAHIARVCQFLHDDPDLDFQFLSSLSAVDFIQHFDVVYHLTSLGQQHTGVVKTRLYGRESLSLPSVYPVWRGADFQEREVWDLMGVRFEGHPLRKDFL